MYERKMISVQLLDDTGAEDDEIGHNMRIIDAWTYILTDYRPELNDLPYIGNFTDGCCGKKYILRHQRAAVDFIAEVRMNTTQGKMAP